MQLGVASSSRHDTHPSLVINSISHLVFAQTALTAIILACVYYFSFTRTPSCTPVSQRARIVARTLFPKNASEKYNIALSLGFPPDLLRFFTLPSLPAFRYASFFKTGGPLSRRSFYGRICNFKLTGSRAAPRCFDVGRPLARLAHREISWFFFIVRFTTPVTQIKRKSERERESEKGKMMEASPDRH